MWVATAVQDRAPLSALRAVPTPIVPGVVHCDLFGVGAPTHMHSTGVVMVSIGVKPCVTHFMHMAYVTAQHASHTHTSQRQSLGGSGSDGDSSGGSGSR